MRYPSSSSGAGKKGLIPPSSAYCFIQTLNGLDGTHLYWGGLSTVSTDSNANLTDTPSNNNV